MMLMLKFAVVPMQMHIPSQSLIGLESIDQPKMYLSRLIIMQQTKQLMISYAVLLIYLLTGTITMNLLFVQSSMILLKVHSARSCHLTLYVNNFFLFPILLPVLFNTPLFRQTGDRDTLED